jgi:HD-like signal output (HDOD) protein
MTGDEVTIPVVDEGAVLRNLASRFRELPAMPATVRAVLDQLSGPDWSIAGVEATIAADPALVARMISVSNSAMYGATQEIRSLNQALVRLGFRGIRSLVVVAAARALFPQDDDRIGRWGRELWRHSAGCGVAARTTAGTVRGADRDDAFTAGVLHDMGKVVVMLNRPDDYGRVLELVRGGRCDTRVAERVILDTDHAELAALLLSRWNLPAVVTGAVVGHHAPDSSGDHVRLSRIVACGDLMARLHGGDDAYRLRPLLDEELARLGLNFADGQELAERVRTELADLGDLA